MKQKWTALASLALISCIHQPPAETTAKVRTPAQSYNAAEPVHFTGPTLTYTKFHDELMDSQHVKVADMIKTLSAKYPDHLLLRTAMYQSDSLQGATFSEPRVIVFGPDAKFIFSFNGNPGQGGGADIETAAFDDDDGTFSFREIVFKAESKAGKRPLYLDDDEVEFENERIIISKPNPQKCMECHGYAVTGPIWETYPNWPGAYGSSDDILYGSFVKGSGAYGYSGYLRHGGFKYLKELSYPRSQGRVFDLPSGAKDREVEGYLAYLAGKSTHPRYKYLPAQPFEEGFLKYLAHTPAEQIDSSDAVAAASAQLGISDADRLNDLFMTELGRIFDKGLLVRMQKLGLKEKWASIKWRILTGISDDGVSVSQASMNNPDLAMSNAIGKTWSEALRKKHGKTFAEYLRGVMSDEMQMQIGKLTRVEKNLGPIERQKRDDEQNPSGRFMYDPLHFYSSIALKSKDHITQLALRLESDNLFFMAALGYLLHGEGIELEDYALTKSRALTVNGVDLYQVEKFLNLSFGAPPPQ